MVAGGTMPQREVGTVVSAVVEQHVVDAVASAGLVAEPFPYFQVEDVFPQAFYERLLGALPPLEAYAPLAETGTLTVAGSYAQRYVLDLRELAARSAFWAEALPWLAGERLATAILDKFAAAWRERFGLDTKVGYRVDLRLVRDFTSYSIGPHTDAPQKLVSLLFYLPPDGHLRALGTSVYRPKDPTFRCEGGPHYGFERFERVDTAPFLPNSLLGFPKLSRSFHGVEPILEEAVERDLLLYNLYVTRLVKRMPERGAPPLFVFDPSA
jgi:hypothetical protein